MKLTSFTNIFSTVTAVLTALTGIMASVLKCSSVGDLAATCSGDLLPAAYMGYAASVFGVLTLILKSLRPGGLLHSWFGETAVVVPLTSSKSGVGTVSPEQVKTP